MMNVFAEVAVINNTSYCTTDHRELIHVDKSREDLGHGEGVMDQQYQGMLFDSSVGWLHLFLHLQMVNIWCIRSQ
jgi:hypothetical protein